MSATFREPSLCKDCVLGRERRNQALLNRLCKMARCVINCPRSKQSAPYFCQAKPQYIMEYASPPKIHLVQTSNSGKRRLHSLATFEGLLELARPCAESNVSGH